MNIQLIKKFEQEFEYMLIGGNLQFTEDKLNWFPFESKDWCKQYQSIQIVIDDDFVKFRKALAQGQKVEYNFGNSSCEYPNIWKRLESQNFYGIPKEYRIIETKKEQLIRELANLFSTEMRHKYTLAQQVILIDIIHKVFEDENM